MVAKGRYETPWGVTDSIGTATIDVGLSGPNTLIAGTHGYFIVVLGYLLVSSGNVEVSFETQSGSVISGPYLVTQYGGNIGPPTGIHFVCKSGEDLVLNLGGPIQVGGHILYGLVSGGQ